MTTTLDTSPRLLDVKEAAALLHVSLRTAYRMVEEGELHAVKVRGSYRIHPDVIARVYDQARKAA